MSKSPFRWRDSMSLSFYRRKVPPNPVVNRHYTICTVLLITLAASTAVITPPRAKTISMESGTTIMTVLSPKQAPPKLCWMLRTYFFIGGETTISKILARQLQRNPPANKTSQASKKRKRKIKKIQINKKTIWRKRK